MDISNESFEMFPKIKNSMNGTLTMSSRNIISPVPIPIPLPNPIPYYNLDPHFYLKILSPSITHRISTDLLSFKDIKSILNPQIGDYDFENEKLEKLLLQLPKNKYFFTTDWVNAFSLGEIKRYFFHELKLEEVKGHKIEELKKRIGEIKFYL
jgi:hypothetical protein